MTEVCLRPASPETARETHDRIAQNVAAATEAVIGQPDQDPLRVFDPASEIRVSAADFELAPEAEAQFREATDQLGPGSEEDEQAEHVGLPIGYTLITDGGTGPKMFTELMCALRSPVKPGRIVCIASEEREVPPVGHKSRERELTVDIINRQRGLLAERAALHDLLTAKYGAAKIAAQLDAMIEASSPEAEATALVDDRQRPSESSFATAQEVETLLGGLSLGGRQPLPSEIAPITAESLPDNEYDLMLLLLESTPGFVPEFEPPLNQAYDPATHEFVADYNVKLGANYTGQMHKVGSIDGAPVYMLRADRHYFFGHNPKARKLQYMYKAPETETAIRFVDFVFGRGAVGFATSASYKPSREISLAAIHLDDELDGNSRPLALLTYGAETYARERGELNEHGDPIIKQPALGHLGGEVHTAAVRLKGLREKLIAAGQLPAEEAEQAVAA